MTKTWTRNDLIEAIHTKVGISITDSSKIIEDIFEEILIALEDNKEVKLSSFGTFSIKQKQSRVGRNPKTGVEAMITARKVVTFNPSNHFRKKVK